MKSVKQHMKELSSLRGILKKRHGERQVMLRLNGIFNNKFKASANKASQTRKPKRNLSRNKKLCLSLSFKKEKNSVFSPRRTLGVKIKTETKPSERKRTSAINNLSAEDHKSYLVHSYMIERVISKIESNKIVNGRFVSPQKLIRKVQNFRSLERAIIMNGDKVNKTFCQLPDIAKVN
ncbi:unnamed protein product [Moneuplotes crassus]|uniref:Uncharacterized protein n=1 Tax=Euplotes crassus TaxID=5936 RepID=A0AAD1Y946_EUPCR|nr:unnamed protein product [Moneuplotes crassus]